MSLAWRSIFWYYITQIITCHNETIGNRDHFCNSKWIFPIDLIVPIELIKPTGFGFNGNVNVDNFVPVPLPSLQIRSIDACNVPIEFT